MFLFFFTSVVFAAAAIIVVLLSFVPDRRESRDNQAALWKPLGEPFSVLSIARAFDADHALVWETQVPLL
jgi:hypothetical protein